MHGGKWQIGAVDVIPIPNFSGLAIPERLVETGVSNASVDSLPFSNGYFDAVLLTEVLEHLIYPPTLFNEIRRLLMPGGRLYFPTPNPAALSKILRLVRGLNNEPFLDVFMTEQRSPIRDLLSSSPIVRPGSGPLARLRNFWLSPTVCDRLLLLWQYRD